MDRPKKNLSNAIKSFLAAEEQRTREDPMILEPRQRFDVQSRGLPILGNPRWVAKTREPIDRFDNRAQWFCRTGKPVQADAILTVG